MFTTKEVKIGRETPPDVLEIYKQCESEKIFITYAIDRYVAYTKGVERELSDESLVEFLNVLFTNVAPGWSRTLSSRAKEELGKRDCFFKNLNFVPVGSKESFMAPVGSIGG